MLENGICIVTRMNECGIIKSYFIDSALIVDVSILN